MENSSKKVNPDEGGYPRGTGEWLTNLYYGFLDLTQPALLKNAKTHDFDRSKDPKNEAEPGPAETTAPKQKDKTRGTNINASA